LKTLINNIFAYLDAVKATSELSAQSVWKGFSSVPENIPIDSFPYVAIDDGGERVENGSVGQGTQNRFYSVIIEMGVAIFEYEDSLDAIFDLSNEVKALFEKEANRQKDGHIWGVNITPFQGQGSNQQFFRGRSVTVEFWELEDTYDLY